MAVEAVSGGCSWSWAMIRLAAVTAGDTQHAVNNGLVVCSREVARATCSYQRLERGVGKGREETNKQANGADALKTY